MTFRRFEEIQAWQLARRIASRVDHLSEDGTFSRDFGLRDQARRAAVSMMSNIAEGFSRRSDQEFAQYLFYAKSSGAELQSHLYLALDRRHISDEQFSTLYEEIDHFARQLSNLITFLRRPISSQRNGRSDSGSMRSSRTRNRIQGTQ